MAESVSVHDKVNKINDSESETQSDGYQGTSDEEDTNQADDNDEKKKRPDQGRSQTPQRRKSNKKRARDEPEEEEADEGMKRNERRAANRLSAFQSRQRRKSIISDLQVGCICITLRKYTHTNHSACFNVENCCSTVQRW
jgi:hypothetical protein